MRKYASLSLVVAAVFWLSADNVSARGPHGGVPSGGVPHVGGPAGPHRAGPATLPHVGNPAARLNPIQVHPNRNIAPGAGNRIARQTQLNRQWQQHAGHVRNNTRGRYNHLFTPTWFAHHPNAWRYRHPHADVWAAVATWPVLANWVGVTGGYPYEYGTVYQDSTYYVTDEDSATGEVAVEPAMENAADLAAQGATDQTVAESEATDWLPLGVFAVTTPDSASTPNRLFQFSINRNGRIGGTYYDAVSGQEAPVQGAVNKTTQRAAWTVGTNQEIVLETNLGSFTEDHAKILVHPAKGQTEEWMMVRLEGPKATPTNTEPTTETTPTHGTPATTPNPTTSNTTN